MSKTSKVLGFVVLMGLSASAFAGSGFHFPVWPFPFPTFKAPEIDPASAMAGLTMLAGALAVIRGRRAKN
jgi:hypothetical protein